MKNPLFSIVTKLLTRNKIVHDKKELAFQIQSHPSYPSLHAITGVLDHFNIENIAAEVPTDSETLEQLPDSFIAQVNTDDGNDLVTVSKAPKDDSYTLFSGASKEEKVTRENFITRFTGIIVAVEKTEGNPVNIESNNSVKEIVLLSSIFVLSIIALIASNHPTPFDFIYLGLTIFGIIASYSILKQELGETTTIGNAFCSGNSEKRDCDAVLSSKGAEIIKNHKLSDLSLIYFSGLLLTFFLNKSLAPIYSISLLALPITAYSIYYQYKIVKSWCMLCLTIVAVLWLQAGLAFLSLSNGFTIGVISSIITVTSFLTVYLLWNYVKPLVKDVTTLQKEKIEFVKFKRNFNLFDILLQKSPTLNTRINSNLEIVFGNNEAPLELVVITNPFCGHCKPVHEIVNTILNRYANKIKVIIRFNVPVDHKENNSFIVSSTLVELYNTKGTEDCKKAMDEIYHDGNYNEWLSNWGNTKASESSIEVLKAQKQWCSENAINFTPEMLINGKSFPKEYERSDLVFFIEDLEENYSVSTVV